MPVRARLQRLGYRIAYRILQVLWFVLRPATEGVKCVLMCEGDVLLVRHTYGPAVWDLPGGRTKRGEAPLRTAQREMHEELGLEGVDWQEVGTIQGRQGFRRDTVRCFAAELSSRAVQANPVELDQTRWCARGALPERLGPYVAATLRRAWDADPSATAS